MSARNAPSAVPTVTNAWRVMHIPELFALIATYLEREMVDLVALSTVSKHIRRLTLPHMVRYLDIRIQRSDQICRFFEANPGPALIEKIEFVRIREDDVYDKFRYRSHSRRSRQPVPPFPIYWKWGEVGSLLSLIEKRSKTPLPRIDISVAASDIAFMKSNLERTPNLMSRICALRMIVDIDATDSFVYASEAEMMAAVTNAFGMSWDTFPSLIQSISSPNLVVFEFDNTVHRPFPSSAYAAVAGIAPPREIWSDIVQHLAKHVRELSVGFCLFDIDHAGYTEVMLASWPRLRSARIKFAGSHDSAEWVEILSFLTVHGARLEDLAIENNQNGPVGFNHTFRRLQSISLSRDVFKCYRDADRASRQAAFAERHSHSIREWSLSGNTLADARTLLDQPSRASLLGQIRVLRASKEVAEHYIRAGARPRHLQLDAAKDLDSLQLWRWLNSKGLRKAAEAITCLDIEVSSESLADLNLQLGHVFSSDHFPNLQELILCSTCEVPQVPAITPAAAAAQLR
ncbi:unnamed protein product, partial [Tilletia caries]